MIKWNDLPVEIQERMLEEQERQTGKRDAEVFKKMINAGDSSGGFDWSDTVEGWLFWDYIIEYGGFDIFFKRYPKKQEPETFTTSSGLTVWKEEKLMEVWDNERHKLKRVVFGKKNGGFLAWVGCDSLDEGGERKKYVSWNYAKEIEQVKKHTLKDLKEILGYEFELIE